MGMVVASPAKRGTKQSHFSRMCSIEIATSPPAPRNDTVILSFMQVSTKLNLYIYGLSQLKENIPTFYHTLSTKASPLSLPSVIERPTVFHFRIA
jgi:hypothetical protein